MAVAVDARCGRSSSRARRACRAGTSASSTNGSPRVGVLEQRGAARPATASRARRDVAGDQLALVERHEVRRRTSRAAAARRARPAPARSRARGGGRRPCRRSTFSPTETKCVSSVGAAARAGDARLGVDHDVVDAARPARAARAPSSAAVGKQPGLATSVGAARCARGISSGQAVDGGVEQVGRGVRLPYQRS